MKPKTSNSRSATPTSGDPRPSTRDPRSIGIDIVEVGRIDDAVRKYGRRFLDRIFTAEEQRYAMGKRRQAETLAGRFAAKEAFMKALGKRQVFQEIEILQRGGRPFVSFRGAEYGGVSISHERSHAVAVMLLDLPVSRKEAP